MAAVGPVAMSFSNNENLWFVMVLGMLILFIGLIVMGVATIRAKALPGWTAALPLIIGALGLLMFCANPDDPNTSANMVSGLRLTRMVSSMLFGTAWIALGYTLWGRSGVPVRVEPIPA